MRDLIIVRYSEIFLKSEFVRNQLQKRLAENIKRGLNKKGIDGRVKRTRGRIFIETQDNKSEDVLKHTFGVDSFSWSKRMELSEIEDYVRKNNLIRGRTFAVRVNRTGRHEFTSQEFAAKIGEIIRGMGKDVDLGNPDEELCIEIRGSEAYVYSKKIPGSGGLPFGSQGKVNCFIGSKNGVVACWLMMKRGCIPVIYHSRPIDVLENWSSGISLEKHQIESLEEVKSELTTVFGDNLEGNGIQELKNHQKMFKTILTPLIGLKKGEIGSLWTDINK